MASVAVVVRNYKEDVPGAISADGTRWEFPPVITRTKTGKSASWVVYVRAIDAGQSTVGNYMFLPFSEEYLENKPLAGIAGYIDVESKQEGAAKHRETAPTIVPKGKNIGRANATNAVCQALRDAYSMWNKQTKKSSHATETEENPAANLFPPMLAQFLRDQKKPIDWSAKVFVSRKYDGLRGIITLVFPPDCDCTTTAQVQITASTCPSRIIAYSRKRLLFPPQPHIFAELEPVLLQYWRRGIKLFLDGEFYEHGVKLQDISGHMRNVEKSQNGSIRFMIYDCFVTNTPADNPLNIMSPFSDRYAIIEQIFADYPTLTYCELAESVQCTTRAEVDAFYSRAIADKYEGAMIRLNAPYAFSYNDYHSKVLLKMKERYDGEFVVVSWTTGRKGKAANALMIICIVDTPGGMREFPVTPALTLAERNALSEKMPMVEANGETYFHNTYLGKQIVVEFDDWSKDGIPQRASTELKFRVVEPTAL